MARCLKITPGPVQLTRTIHRVIPAAGVPIPGKNPHSFGNPEGYVPITRTIGGLQGVVRDTPDCFPEQFSTLDYNSL